MPIEANVSGQPQITASVGETLVDVSVSGGVGPTGQTGPAGTTSWNGLTDKPSAFNPTQHASTHATGGVDPLIPAAIGAATVQAAESLQLQVDGKAASSHTHPASAITSGTINSSRLPLATASSAGAIYVGTGLSAASGVTSVVWGSSSTSSCRGDDARLANAREWSAVTATQAETEAGTSTDRRAFTVQRVWQAIAAWWAGSDAKTKLDGIAAGATANQTDAHLLDRANHTGTQEASTISDFESAVVAAAPPTTDASLLTTGTLAAGRLPASVVQTDNTGRVPSALLPSYVDDVIEAANYASLPGSPETGKIYITLDTNKVYRWSGSTYVEVSAGASAWSDITGKPSFAAVATSGSYSDLSNVPSTFAPASHTHDFTQVTDDNTYTNFLPEGGSLATALSEIDSAISGKAAATHTHATSEIKTAANKALSTFDNVVNRYATDGYIQCNGLQCGTIYSGADDTVDIAKVFSITFADASAQTTAYTGKIGTTSGLVLKTGTDGVIESLAQGTAGQVLVVSAGATSMEWKTLSASDIGAAALSHAHSVTADITAGNWKVLYSNGSGAIVELALGTSGKVLTSSGTASAPTWETPSTPTIKKFWWF